MNTMLATIIPYELLARVVANKLRVKLDKEQAVENSAGFRAEFSCDNQLFTAELFVQTCQEFNLPLWSTAVSRL